MPPDGETTIVRLQPLGTGAAQRHRPHRRVPGQAVERGEVLGVIGDALGARHAARCGRDDRGGARLHPQSARVSQGDALVHIADVSGSRYGGPARAPT